MKTYTIEEMKEKVEILKALRTVTKGTVIADDVDNLIENYSSLIDRMQNSVMYKDCCITRDSRHGKYKIYAGGYVATSLTEATSPSIKETWAKLKNDGYFNDDGLILKDITGYSASTTISIIAGCNMSGPKILKEILW